MNAVVLEEVCKMNLLTRQLNSFAEELPQRVLDKHYLRKHGANAYYGQK
jgi:L-ribulose-5-phosphate 4-epimerase